MGTTPLKPAVCRSLTRHYYLSIGGTSFERQSFTRKAVITPQYSRFECRANRSSSNLTSGVSQQPNLRGNALIPNAQAVSTNGTASNQLSPLIDSTISRNFNRIINVGLLSAGALATVSYLAGAELGPWELYQHAVTSNPLETKALISSIVYLLGDLLAQGYEGKEPADWDRVRAIRSALCGLAHGPLSHLYYIALDNSFLHQSLIDQDSWLVPFVKVGIDQTVWSIVWNSSYYIMLGLLKAESLGTIATGVKNSWLDLLKAGWRLWPLVHVITYSFIPIQHRLLFVDAVELAWVGILSTYGQQQRQALAVAAMAQQSDIPTIVACPLPGVDGEGGDFAEEILRGIKVEHQIIFEDAQGRQTIKSPEEVYTAAAIPVEESETTGKCR